MSDYIFQIPSPSKIRGRSRASTAGDSTTQVDQWLWTPQALRSTPSKKSGMPWTEEVYLRARAVNWIVRICITLQLPQLIIATAAAYIHRFYMRKSLQKYPPKVMSATALFLATKVEEVPRKLEYVVREYLKIDEDGNEKSGLFTEDSNEFQVFKQQILYNEDILLRALCFDLALDHPYVTLVHKVKLIHDAHCRSGITNSSLSIEMADRSKAKSIAQAAWGFVNDSLLTPLCLVAKPELIAAAAFLLAASHRLCERPSSSESDQKESWDNNDLADLDRYLSIPISSKEGHDVKQIKDPWWKAFQVQSLDEIYETANAMLNQYTLSSDDYIRDRAGKLAKFPGRSLLDDPDELTQAQPTLKPDPDQSATKTTKPERLKSYEEGSHRALSTPARAATSDNMDLGTPAESDKASPKSNPASPGQLRRESNSHPEHQSILPRKKSQPPELSPDQEHGSTPKKPKLEHISTPIEANQHPIALSSEKYPSQTPTSSHEHPPPTIDQTTDEPVAEGSRPSSDTSLSDMEDGSSPTTN